jgi:hypothetical protein
MALTIVQRKVVENTAANGGITLSPAATAGNLIVLALGLNDTIANTTVPTGFNRDVSIDGTSAAAHTEIVSKIAAGGETTIAFTHPSVFYDIEAWELNDSGGGVWVLDQIDSREWPTGQISAQCSTGIVPTTADSIAIVANKQNANNGGSETIDSSFTLRDAATLNRMIVADKIKTTNASENPITTWLTSRPAQIVIANYKIASASVARALGLSVGASIPTLGATALSGEN